MEVASLSEHKLAPNPYSIGCEVELFGLGAGRLRPSSDCLIGPILRARTGGTLDHLNHPYKLGMQGGEPFTHHNGLRGKLVAWNEDILQWEVMLPNAENASVPEKFLKVIGNEEFIVSVSILNLAGEHVFNGDFAGTASIREVKESFVADWPKSLLLCTEILEDHVLLKNLTADGALDLNVAFLTELEGDVFGGDESIIDDKLGREVLLVRDKRIGKVLNCAGSFELPAGHWNVHFRVMRGAKMRIGTDVKLSLNDRVMRIAYLENELSEGEWALLRVGCWNKGGLVTVRMMSADSVMTFHTRKTGLFIDRVVAIAGRCASAVDEEGSEEDEKNEEDEEDEGDEEDEDNEGVDEQQDEEHRGKG